MLLKIQHFFTVMRDIFITDIRYLLPCALKWFYHRKIKRDIFLFPLIDPISGKKAILYQHGKGKLKNNDAPSTLVLHGLYAHPFVMLHLVKIAQQANKGPVFSLYVRYDETNMDPHRSLIHQAIKNVEKISLAQDPSCKGIILVGHSSGAVEAAYAGFVEKNRGILSVISIGGQLKVVESPNKSGKQSLNDALDRIYHGIQSNPHLPLYQIVGRYDWSAPLESMIIRKNEGCYHIVEGAMHFNVLFHKDIYGTLSKFLQQSSSKLHTS